jgi:hypothetical protein
MSFAKFFLKSAAYCLSLSNTLKLYSMAEYGREQRNQLSRAIASNSQHNKQLKRFADNRTALTIRGKVENNTCNDICFQNKLVAQLATRLSNPVVFAGSAYELEQLILQWAVPRGTRVAATQTDSAGHHYRVRFRNDNGPAITIGQADSWVQIGISHYVDSDSSPSSTEGSG